jgi:heme oxygenase
MIEPPWMLIRLGLETGAHHTLADEDRLAALEIRTRTDYQAFLSTVFGFEAPVEQALLRTRDLGTDVLRERLKVGRLRRDLEALGMTTNEIDALPVAANVTIKSTEHALGWLFVLERQTLLSGLISRHLVRTMPTVSTAVSYLEAYGDTPGARFRLLGTQLGTYGERYGAASIVAGANDAFRAQRLWYQARPLSGTSRGRPSQPQNTRDEMRAETIPDPALALG